MTDTFSSILRENTRKTTVNCEITHREMEILSLVGEGLSNREITEKLFLSEGAVRNYVTALMEKLSLRDRTPFVIFYLQNLSQD